MPDPAASGSMPRRMEHLVDVMLRKIKNLKPEAIDEPIGPLTRQEFRAWAINGMGVSEKEIPVTWVQEKQLGES